MQQRQAEADHAEQNKDALAQLGAYRSLVSDFDGLSETSAAAKKLALLKESGTLKAALKNERDQIAEQFELEREISPKLHAYADGSAPDPTALRTGILQAMHGLSDQAAHARNEAKRLIFSRVLSKTCGLRGSKTGSKSSRPDTSGRPRLVSNS